MKWRTALDRVRALVGALDREGAIARALFLAHDRNLNLDLASALEVARTLASALDLDRAHVLDQARALVGDLVSNIASALDSDRALDRKRERALVRAAMSARDLASALDLALASVLDGGYAPARTAAHDLDLSRDLASALASYHSLLRALASYPVLDRGRDLTGDFARYRDLAQDLARCLDRHLAGSVAVDADGARPLPRRVRVAVWLLPRSWQPRYREEYRAELARLRPSERHEYARRVLADAWQLRRALAGTEWSTQGLALAGSSPVAESSGSSDLLPSVPSATRADLTRAGVAGPSCESLQKSQGKSSSEPVRSPVAREHGRSHNSAAQTTLPITIYLSHESAHEQVEAAVEELLAVAGAHVEHRDDPVFGSWFRRMRARIDQAVHSPLAREAAIVAAHAAESRLVHAQDATVTATMLQNLGPVLAALHPTKDAVIRVGALLIVKVDWIVAIHQLTSAQQLQLDHQPQLAQSPHDILSALERRTGNSTPSVEGMDGTCGSTTAPRSLNGNPAPLRITSNNGESSTPSNSADQQIFPEASAGA